MNNFLCIYYIYFLLYDELRLRYWTLFIWQFIIMNINVLQNVDFLSKTKKTNFSKTHYIQMTGKISLLFIIYLLPLLCFFFLFIWCLSLFHSFICNVMYDEWYIIISANYHTSRSLKYYIFNHHRQFCIQLKNI